MILLSINFVTFFFSATNVPAYPWGPTCDRARDVTGDNGDKASSEETGALRPQLLRQQVCRDCGQPGEQRGQEHAHVPAIVVAQSSWSIFSSGQIGIADKALASHSLGTPLVRLEDLHPL